MVYKKPSLSLLCLSFLISSLVVQKTSAHNPRLIAAAVIGGAMGIGGVYNLCKKENNPKTGLVMIASGIAIAAGAPSIIKHIDAKLAPKTFFEKTTYTAQKGINALSQAVQNPESVLDSLDKKIGPTLERMGSGPLSVLDRITDSINNLFAETKPHANRESLMRLSKKIQKPRK